MRSTLGSLSEGAVSPNGLTEGVYLVIWQSNDIAPLTVRGRQLGDPLARSALGSTSGGAAERSEAEGVYYDDWCAPVGATNLVTRNSRNRAGR